MTSFSVQPAAVRQLAQQVDRGREDVETSQKHLTKMQDFEGGEGVIGRLTGGHREAYQTLNNWLGKLANPTLTSVGQAINDAATYYERTDQASAAKLDGTYPAADAVGQRKQTGYISADGTPAEFKDVMQPKGRLNEVKDYRDEMRSDYDWWDAFSPMTAIGAAIEAVSHVAAWLGALERPINPWDEIVKPWVGDWAGLRAATDVLNNVPTAKDAIRMVKGKVCLVDGTITPCWSYTDHQELWSRKKGTTGFNTQLISLLGGTPRLHFRPAPGKHARQDGIR